VLTFPVYSVQRDTVWDLYLSVYVVFVVRNMTEADNTNAF